MNTNATISIVLIEDDIFLAKMYQTKLTVEGYQVTSCIDGKEGLKAIAEKKPDIILLDIILPKMDGWQVLKAVKADPAIKNIPILLMTNLGQKEDIDKGLSLGACDYIIKSHFTPGEIVLKIKQILNK